MSNRTIIGIDPGITGGIAMLNWTDPARCDLWAMPVEARSEKNDKKQVNVKALCSLSTDIAAVHSVDLVVIERPSAPPVFGGAKRFGMGAFAALDIGHSFGCVHMFAALFEQAEIRFVQPAVWKKALKLKREKHHAITRAHKLYPASKKVITLKKHDGLAEALLIAHYAKLYL